MAYQKGAEVDLSYVRCTNILMAGAGYPMLATHDPRLIEIGIERAKFYGKEQYELQMLYGIRPNEQRRLVAGRAHGAGVPALRRAVVRLPDAPAGRATGERDVLRPLAGFEGIGPTWLRSLAILGGGKIGEALLTGLLRGERTPADIVVSEKHPERASYLASTYGVKTLDVAEAAAAARTLVLCVKPQDIDDAARRARPGGGHRPPDRVGALPASPPPRSAPRCRDGVPVVRCMPNTPALVDEAMTAVSAGAHADEARTWPPPRRCSPRWDGSCACRSRSWTR